MYSVSKGRVDAVIVDSRLRIALEIPLQLRSPSLRGLSTGVGFNQAEQLLLPSSPSRKGKKKKSYSNDTPCALEVET